MSLLLAAGHVDANDYPLGVLQGESQLVEDRINGHHATSAILLQAAIASMFSEKGAKAFRDMVKEMNGK